MNRPSPTPSLWRDGDFLKLWSGQTVSLFGTLIGRFALPALAVIGLGATPLQLSALRLAELVPGLLVSLAAGVWVDRLRRRPLLIAADVGRALLLATVPIAALSGRLRMPHLYLVAAAVSLLTMLFEVAYPAYLPSLVGKARLVAANSRLQTSAAVAEMTGFGLAGFLVQTLTAPLTILVDALTYLVSAASLALIRQPEPPPQPAADQGVAGWAQLAEGLRTLAQQPILRALALVGALFELSSAIVGTLIFLYLARDLHLAPGVMGLIFSVGGISSFLGALWLEPMVAGRGLGPLLSMAIAAWVMAYAFLPLASGPLWLVVGFLVLQQMGDAAWTIYLVTEGSLRQLVAPAQALGRVTSAQRLVTGAATFAGTLLGGLFGQTLGARVTLGLALIGFSLAWVMVRKSPAATVLSSQ